MKKIILLCVFLTVASASAQKAEKDRFLPKGNAEFTAKNYDEAEASFRMSQSKFPNKAAAAYNLGNTIYKINQPAEAKNAYAKAIETARSRTERHRAYHNIGNIFMKEKDYKSAVEAYKQALRNNPADDETRYNYALAKKLLRDNPPKDDKEVHDKKPEGNQKQEQPAPDKGGDEEDKNNPQNDGDNKDQGNKPPKQQPQSQGISKQRVQNLLDAVNNEERKVQNKVNSRKVQGTAANSEKDW
ncbi:MAG TPA: tetratricopeptide repeat protein [Flavobacterium sp.]|jgi:tetratricopeptide (TPR) repeat protein